MDRLEKGQLYTHCAGLTSQLLGPVADCILGWDSAPASSHHGRANSRAGSTGDKVSLHTALCPDDLYRETTCKHCRGRGTSRQGPVC